MDRCALFVDASYVLADGAMAVHGTRRGESVSWDYEGLVQLLSGLARDRTGLPVLRCYWYEATVDGRRTAEQDAIADIPGIKLRVAKIRPGRREGVETEIHRDLTTLARNNAISEALVISAEEDLAQVIADVQDLGMRVTLVHLAVDGNWTISRALRQESDDIIEIGGEQLRPYVELIVGAEPAPAAEADDDPTPISPSAGRPGGWSMAIRRRPGRPTSRCPPGRPGTARPPSTPRRWWRSTSGPPRSCPRPPRATTGRARTAMTAPVMTATTAPARSGPARTGSRRALTVTRSRPGPTATPPPYRRCERALTGPSPRGRGRPRKSPATPCRRTAQTPWPRPARPAPRWPRRHLASCGGCRAVRAASRWPRSARPGRRPAGPARPARRAGCRAQRPLQRSAAGRDRAAARVPAGQRRGLARRCGAGRARRGAGVRQLGGQGRAGAVAGGGAGPEAADAVGP